MIKKITVTHLSPNFYRD